MRSIRLALLCGAMVLAATPALAQQSNKLASAATAAPLGDTWGQLKALPLHAHMHVSAEQGGSTCYFISADDTALTCGRRDGSPKGQHVFPRATVKSVKLTRYGVSTAAGAGIGAGVGALVGVGVVHSTDWFAGDARAILALGGGLIGAAIGGPSDMFRGPTIYRRPKS